jgi:hypothetical protein
MINDRARGDRPRARDPCRGPHDPSGLHAVSSLHDSDRSEGETNMLLHRADAPNALPPTGSDAHPGPNTPQSKRSPGLESAHAARSATEVAGFRCTPQSVPKQGW